MRIWEHMRSLERLLFSMSTRRCGSNLDYASHHHLLNPSTQLVGISVHHNHHDHQRHPNPNHLFSLHHHYKRRQQHLRRRRRLNPPKRLRLDPRRRRAKLPQIPANIPLELLPRPSDPLRRQDRRPIPDRRRPVDRAHRHQRHETVRQRGRAAERFRHLSARLFHLEQELFRRFRLPRRYSYLERGGRSAPECRRVVCV